MLYFLEVCEKGTGICKFTAHIMIHIFKNKITLLSIFLGLYFLSIGSGIDSLRFELQKKKGEEFLSFGFEIIESIPKGETLQRIELLNQLLDTSIVLNDSSYIAKTNLFFSSSYVSKGEYKKAVTHVAKAREIYEKLIDEKGMAMCDMNMGVIQIQFFHNYISARKYYESARIIFEKLDDKINMGKVYSNIGNCFANEGKIDSAIAYCNKALEVADKELKIATLSNLGFLQKIKGEYEKALGYYFSVYEILEEDIDSVYFAFNNMNIASVYKMMRSYGLALKYAIVAERLFIKYQDSDELFQAYNLIAELYELSSQHKQAIAYYKKRIVLGDSIFSAKSRKEIELLKTKYDLQAKDNRVKIQNLKIASLENSKKNRLYINVLLIVTLLTVLIAAFLFLTNQKKKLENQKLKNEKNKDELEMRNKELMSYSLLRVQKNTLLQELSDSLDEFLTDVKMKSDPRAKKLKRVFNKNLSIEKDWDEFRMLFENVNEGFLDKLKNLKVSLSKTEEKLCIMLKLKMSTKEIASMTNVDPHSVTVARYRLRKKLGLSNDQNLDDYICDM